MNWMEQGDYYCERLDLAFWAEPLNAVTNLAFILAAMIMYRRLRGTGLVEGYILVTILAAIGVGSFLFHTFATNWAAVADTAPIGVFILTCLFLVGYRFLVWPMWASILLTIGFLPYAWIMFPILDGLPFFTISDFYWLVPLLLLAFAPLVWRKDPDTARGLLIGTAILVVSITLRSFDMIWCDQFPIGTHIFWHILNGIMLGWMIEVYRRHMLARRATSV